MRGTGAATPRPPLTVCEASFPRASRPLRSCSMALLCRRGPLVHEAKPLQAVARRTSATSDSCSRRCILLTRRLVVSGLLSTNAALLIDRSAEPLGSSLTCSWQTLAALHAGTRLATSLCPAPRARSLWPQKRRVFLFCRPRHRRLVPPTHLELVIDVGKNSRKLDPDCRRPL